MEMKYLVTLVFVGSIMFVLTVFFGYVEYTRWRANRCIREQFCLEFGSEAWKMLTELRDFNVHNPATWDEQEYRKERFRELLEQSGVDRHEADSLIIIVTDHPITWQYRLDSIDRFSHL